MKDRPIIFSTPMVKAIFDDRKTQTRRLNGLEKINKRPDDHSQAIVLNDGSWSFWHPGNIDEEWVRSVAYPDGGGFKCPYGKPGDRLWVRETFAPTINVNNLSNWPNRPHLRRDEETVIIYRADGEWDWCDDDGFSTERSYWKPSIFMPKKYARIWLEITNVRVERLQDISRKDAHAEGFHPRHTNGLESWKGRSYGNANLAFEACWNDINGKKHPWSSDSWVWVIEFMRQTQTTQRRT